MKRSDQLSHYFPDSILYEWFYEADKTLEYVHYVIEVSKFNN